MNYLKLSVFFYFLCLTGYVKGQIFNENLILHLNFNNQINDLSETESFVDNYGATYDFDRFEESNSSSLFDGVNDFMGIINDDVYCFEGEISFSLWIKLNEIPQLLEPIILLSNQTSFVFGESRSVGIRMDTESIGMSYYNLTGGSFSYDSTNITFDLEWHHLVGVLNTETNLMKFYVDGVLAGNQTILSDVSLEDLRYVFISGGYRDEYLNSNIDDLRIYNRVISDCEVQSLFNEFIMEVNCSEPVELNCNPVAVESFNLNSTVITYPNPTSGIINLKNIDNFPFIWYIYDNYGRMLKMEESNSLEIDLSEFRNGLYFLKLNNSINPVILGK